MANVRKKPNKSRNKNTGNGSKSGRSDYRERRDDRQNSRTQNPRSKNGRREKEILDTEDAVFRSKSNPFSPWYDKFPAFTADAARIAFSTPLGQYVPLGASDTIVTPGVMALYYNMGVGVSLDNTSPINRSAMRFYTYLRSILKAAGKYDAADLMMYLMAVDSMYSFHSLMVRAYRTANLYSPTNQYYPRRLIQLMGFDDSILDNLAAFRAYINKFALSLSPFWMPAGFEICSRHRWMNEGLYLDSESDRAQTYLFVPEGFWQYNNTVTTGSQLDFVPWMPQTGDISALASHTLEGVISIGNALIGAVINDQDTGDITGDLYRAYGKDKMVQLSEVADLETVLPVYDPVVLSQIENSICTGRYAAGTVISQNPSVNNGAIIFNPQFTRAYTEVTGTEGESTFHTVGWFEGAVLNMHMTSPSPEAIMEATRLRPVLKTHLTTEGDDAPLTYTVDAMGADCISRIGIARLNPYTPKAMKVLFSQTNGHLLQYWTAQDGYYLNSNRVELMALIENFDWHPLMYVATPNNVVGGVDDIIAVAADLDNFTSVSYEKMANMHEAGMLSLFDVPETAIKSN